MDYMRSPMSGIPLTRTRFALRRYRPRVYLISKPVVQRCSHGKISRGEQKSSWVTASRLTLPGALVQEKVLFLRRYMGLDA